MKLKTLLLGSAAALIAVSGARAADAVVAEPEPVDYVKVCDMYGAGFFYIPGTETCLKINPTWETQGGSTKQGFRPFCSHGQPCQPKLLQSPPQEPPRSPRPSIFNKC